MDIADHTRGLERLRDLEGWAEYFIEALHGDQRTGSVKGGLLELGVQEQELRHLRELSWMLRDMLHVLTTRLEFTRPLQPSANLL
jgi:hypothetical protein